ncbi:hypothetical protein FOIG_00175 [Fusarium odoratissimum NRRL 54006]|uniref:Uncharacterized protein n=1 Tax=Fusarium odoratissimum (strain NRRL 54006) TaxID=1089451 RepID=X0K8V1_FUSO5|nr:uncharacterized protein FOIG_00175 [Fusarium odoratissimum NRRL 54006]EXM09863.1 hypothetical protein FOIG_00175 [Fusarium odoratissimum NRRL 54006]
MFSENLVYIVHFVPVWSRANSARQSHYITDDQLTRNHLLDSPSQVHHQKHIHIKITIQPQALNPRSSILVTARESTHIKCPNSHPHLDRKIKASGLTGRAIS